jgi:thiamine biosynthesis protein ThiI
MDRIVVLHYHELWLKGRNRSFFLSRLLHAVRHALEGLPVKGVTAAFDRVLVQLGPEAPAAEVAARLQRIPGIANFAVARQAPRELEAICRTAWEEIRDRNFSTFAVRARRGDKSFPLRGGEIEREVGAYLLRELSAAGRAARVHLDAPELTCWIEILADRALVYAERYSGVGGLPPKTAGRLMCLLSGGFDSAVAAYKMMKRGAYLAFVHFYGTGARPGESSLHVVRELVRRLTPYQLGGWLYLVPFEPVQREIVRFAPEPYRVLLYRRMMLRIAARLAPAHRAAGLVTGDSLSQVASQTLENLIAVDAAVSLPVFRPLLGDDKQEILALARAIGTYEVSAEPFHDCCPVFLPRHPALHATAGELDRAEAELPLEALVQAAATAAVVERYRLSGGTVIAETLQRPQILPAAPSAQPLAPGP